VVPLMAMLRHRALAGSRVPALLLYSSRTLADVIYREELARLEAAGDGLRVVHTLTRERPPGWSGYTRRIDHAMIEEVGFPAEAAPQAFICGPNGLVESVGERLVALGHAPERIKTERFGPSGS
jgi:ferredoxin-NADP reductase